MFVKRTGVNRNAKVGSFPPCSARGVFAQRTGGSFGDDAKNVYMSSLRDFSFTACNSYNNVIPSGFSLSLFEITKVMSFNRLM